MTQSERILGLIQRTTTPLDDDEIAARLDIQPRQAVNQVCRRLAAAGMIVRVREPGFKIVNKLADR
jgi:hypothetical protein